MQQTPFDPLKYGYYKDKDGLFLPVTTKDHPAPQALTELIVSQAVHPTGVLASVTSYLTLLTIAWR